jgi:5'-methylthioadenosine phosphorylase
LTALATVGVFGGSGFYSFLDDVEEVAVDTPYGPPSDRFFIGDVGGTRVAFLPRHGRNHHLPPHAIPYRANVWAMREIGVQRLIGPCAAGSLDRDVPPGSFVVCDQFVDRTSGRADTFYGGPDVRHVSAADPYCPSLRDLIVRTGRAQDIDVRDGGTMVVISGPRFSTRAESAWFASMGWQVVNMTGYPEAWLARELGLCYANVSLITDYDVGTPGADAAPVSHDAVLAVFAANLARVRDLLFAVLPQVGAAPADDPCRAALPAGA